jgi:large subunit ribosomal protein L3
MTHGSMSHRAPGSIGASAYPSRVVKGKKMAGQLGNARVTAKNLQVVDVRPDENLLLVRGAVPGPRRSLVLIKKAG